MKWWEKTVEYYFVIENLSEENGLFISALDGQEEKAGDAILSKDSKWMIIEFKKDEKSIILEKNKYADYEKAKESLSYSNLLHFLVYGEFVNNKFELKAKKYFDQKDTLDTKAILNLGESQDEFVKYVKDLIKFKSKNSKKSGSQRETKDFIYKYQIVLGINKSENKVACMTLEDFAKEKKIELTFDNSKKIIKEQGLEL